MANIKVPNLCGANAEFNSVQSKFESLISNALGGLDSSASSLSSTMGTDITSLETELRALVPELPALPNVNLPSQLTSLSSLTPGSFGHTQLLADITTKFGTELAASGFSLDTLVTDALSAIQGGGDLCSAVPNFELPADGSTAAVEKAVESKQATTDSAEEKPSTSVQNAEVVAQRTGLGLRVNKMITETSTAEDVVADTVTSTTPPTEDTGSFVVAAKTSEVTTTMGFKVETTIPKDASVETIETEETDVVTRTTTSSKTEVKDKPFTAQTSATGSIPSEVNTSTSGIESTPKNKVTKRVTKTEKKNVSEEGFSSRGGIEEEYISELTNNSVILKHAPTSVRYLVAFYSDDNKRGKHPRAKRRSGLEWLEPEYKIEEFGWAGDTFTVNGKVLTITQDKSGPYEGVPAGTTEEWLEEYPTGTKLWIHYKWLETYDPRFVNDD